MQKLLTNYRVGDVVLRKKCEVKLAEGAVIVRAGDYAGESCVCRAACTWPQR